MKNLLTFCAFILVGIASVAADSVAAIRVNRIGYLTDDVKNAVAMLPGPVSGEARASIIDVASGSAVPVKADKAPAWAPMAECYRIDFTDITAPGTYRIEFAGISSPEFRIADDAYAGANEIPLFYMRQQRCGFNPALGTVCHQHDGRLVLSGDRDGEYVDVTGGWHDASDYLQYLTTSANAVYQMLFAYRQNPGVWADKFKADGTPGSNGIPDILDEARWGLEWMQKMNPSDSLFLNQIADDRDHRFYGLPADDTADYDWGPGAERPVYPCHGKPYGLKGNLNRSTGLASSLGKFASSFGLGAEVFRTIDPDFAADLLRRSEVAYEVGRANPGACQTAPCVSPYFYEEDNWADDMELAAAERYRATRDLRFRREAIDYGRLEPVTPWMGADSARHYQWYPFVNLGHAALALDPEKKVSDEFLRNIRSGLQRVAERGASNAFLCGVPFVWCSNNLTVALVTQAMLYRDITGDNSFRQLETAARDWLFGVNPWGKCMIVGLPEHGDTPVDPHSALSHAHGIPVTGGLVDGPVYANIFNSLRGVHLERQDPYAAYQNSIVVYHDDNADYSTNEPTMDGTASTTYFLGRLAAKAHN